MKLVILRRDGVINSVAAPVLKVADWTPLPGAKEAISRLLRDGYRIVVVTNQPAVASGELKIEVLNRIHMKMLDAVRQKGGEIEAIFICPHAPQDKCRCRVPSPGLFEEIAERLKVNLSGVYTVGGSLDDVKAAQSAATRPVLLRSSGEVTANDPAIPAGVPVFDDLAAFADALLTGQMPNP